MPLRAYKTIKALSQALILKTDFVDCYGRNVGLSYAEILEQIKREFPKARASMGALRYVLYSIDRSERLPVRYRSRRIITREFAKSLIVSRSPVYSLCSSIIRRVRRRFPDEPLLTKDVIKIRNALIREGFKVPDWK